MTPEDAQEYLNGKFRTYDERAVRYRLSAYAMILMGLQENDSLLDVGGGDEEMAKCLREEFGWRGVYSNLDWKRGYDIEVELITPGDPHYWRHDFVTCLEVVEHFPEPTAYKLLARLPLFARKGVVVSTPNPHVQDVLQMDDTHRCGIYDTSFIRRGYTVEHHMLYDGYYSGGLVDGYVAYKSTSNQPNR